MSDNDTRILHVMADQLGFLLRIAQLDAYERLHASVDLHEVSLTELTMLHLVGQVPNIRQGVLASALRIKRAHMTKIVQSCLQRALLAVQVPAEDRRAVELTLTEAGRAILARDWPRVSAAEARISQGLSPVERAELGRLLMKLIGSNSAAAMEGA